MQASIDIVSQIAAGSILFFIFRQQTSAHYFTQIAYYGGAKYIATGRGFDLTHTPYTKIYTLYGRSHIYFGYQLALMALMLALLNVPNYFLSTWGTWLVAISLTFSPLWFNPQVCSRHGLAALVQLPSCVLLNTFSPHWFDPQVGTHPSRSALM
jgi:1,3-beta-glucan synthase